MDEDTGIRGRDKEVNEIYKFVKSRISSRKAGILYLTGPPGTGKTMSIRFVLDRFSQVPKLHLNCLNAQSSKIVLSKLCRAFDMEKYVKYNESEMISRLTKKFNSRTSESHLIVFDEMDQLPKSKNVNLFKTIFSWTQQTHSKLVIVGIANTVHLTARYHTISHILGSDYDHLKKIIFKPYSAKDIKDILMWYLENDENFEEACVDPKALEMISRKYARDNGDIRSALNALKSAVDDTLKKTNCKTTTQEPSQFPTPPSTPPPSPCKEKTNLASLANSIKKRQVETHYMDDQFPFALQVILICLLKMTSKTGSGIADARECKKMVNKALSRFSVPLPDEDIRAMLEQLELQGLIAYKKDRKKLNVHDKIVLKASEAEIHKLVQRKEMITNSLNSI